MNYDFLELPPFLQVQVLNPSTGLWETKEDLEQVGEHITKFWGIFPYTTWEGESDEDWGKRIHNTCMKYMQQYSDVRGIDTDFELGIYKVWCNGRFLWQ